MAVYYPQVRLNFSVVFDGFGGPDKPEKFRDIKPKTVNVHLNSYKEADTFEATFDAKAFPFSPEVLRSAAVEIYAFQTDDFVDGPPPGWAQTDNLLVSGLIDTATLSQSADGGTFTVTGRDYTALMIDRQWDPSESGHKGRVPVGRSLKDTVQKLVDEAAQANLTGRILTVEIDESEVNPKTGRIEKTVTRAKETIKVGDRKSKRKKRGIVVKSDSSYWDVIYKLCQSYGFIVYVKGHKVVITKPHVLFAQAADDIHRVAYGKNLANLEVERKLGRESVPQIRVRSYSSKERRTLEGRFPPGTDRVQTGVGTFKEEYKVMTVRDVDDEKILKEIARTAHQTISRGEGIVRFSTKHLRDLNSKDLLQLRPGDPVAIQWDAFKAGELMALPNDPSGIAKKMKILQDAGYSDQIARLVAQQFDKLNYFRQPFYTKEVNLTWDATQGLQLDVEAQNFINVKRNGTTELK